MSDSATFYLNLASFAKKDKEKIKFFDQNQKAFFLDPDATDFENALNDYVKQENIPESKFEELQDMKWEEMPDSFKIFAFQYCIIEGSAYAE